MRGISLRTPYGVQGTASAQIRSGLRSLGRVWCIDGSSSPTRAHFTSYSIRPSSAGGLPSLYGPLRALGIHEDGSEPIRLAS